MFSYGKGLINNVLHQYMQMKSTDCDHKIYLGVEWFESFNVLQQKISFGTCVNVYKEQVHCDQARTRNLGYAERARSVGWWKLG